MAEADERSCARCGRTTGARFRFTATGGAPTIRCLRHAVVYRPVFRRAVRVALVVGTVLFLVNQADVVARGGLTAGVGIKIALTYLVPFSVSTYSALAVNRLGDPAGAG